MDINNTPTHMQNQRQWSLQIHCVPLITVALLSHTISSPKDASLTPKPPMRLSAGDSHWSKINLTQNYFTLYPTLRNSSPTHPIYLHTEKQTRQFYEFWTKSEVKVQFLFDHAGQKKGSFVLQEEVNSQPSSRTTDIIFDCQIDTQQTLKSWCF